MLSVCLTHLYFSGFSSQVIFKNLLRSVSTIVKIIFVFNDAEHVVLDKFFRSRFWHFKKNLNQYFFLGKLLFKFEPFLFLLRFRPMKQGLANLAAETYPLSLIISWPSSAAFTSKINYLRESRKFQDNKFISIYKQYY